LANSIRIVPLGGLGEIGKNMMAIEYGDDMVVIDSGVMFPKEDMLGVDLVLPDTTFLLENRRKLRAILITHGHEDHIGALPFVLRDFNVPVYAPPLAYNLITIKMREHHAGRDIDLREVEAGDVVKCGAIRAEFVRLNHSIPDACGIALFTPGGTVFHTGDFKFDYTPVHGLPADFHRLGELGRQGVLLLLSDSTYAEMPGFTPSESVVGQALDRAIGDAPGRVLVTTFASLIARVQQVIDAAVKHNRKVAIAGRGMIDNVRMSLAKGYIKAPDGTVVDLKRLDDLPDHQKVIITTGSQGEPTSVLVRIANKGHREIAIRNGDTVIISATTIPGNETVVSRTIDNLYRQGAKVLHARNAFVHVHGHASQEELKLMLNLIQPRYFVPVHGEYRMLVAHSDLARAVGIPDENIFVLEDGDVLRVGRDGAGREERVPAGHIYVDGMQTFDTRSLVLRDRRALARDGIVVVVVPVDHATGELAGRPQVVSSGFVEANEAADMATRIESLVERAVNDGVERSEEWSYTASRVREAVTTYLQGETGLRPMIIAVPLEV